LGRDFSKINLFFENFTFAAVAIKDRCAEVLAARQKNSFASNGVAVIQRTIRKPATTEIFLIRIFFSFDRFTRGVTDGYCWQC
jgi:hypothetical protein